MAESQSGTDQHHERENSIVALFHFHWTAAMSGNISRKHAQLRHGLRMAKIRVKLYAV